SENPTESCTSHAQTINNTVNDRIADSRFVGIILDETTNITVDKMLIIYLTYQLKGEPETNFLGNYSMSSGTAGCITAKIKEVLSGRGVALDRVVGLGSDGANVMVGRKAGVAQQLRQDDCPYLLNIHCGAHRTALAARDASKAVRQVSAYVTTLNNVYTYYKNSPIRTHRLHQLQLEMNEGDALSLKQPCATRWLSLERAVKGIRANWACVVMELEEEAAKGCPIAKGLHKQLLKHAFPALTHLLADVLATVNRMNLTFQKEDVNISSIQPIVSMTLANLDDFEKGPGDVEKKFVEGFREGIFCGHRLTHVDEHGFSALRAQYIGEIMKSIKKRFPSGDVSHISDLDTVLNASRFPNTNSALQEYGLDAVERLADFYGAHPNAAFSLVEKERMVRDFRSVKRVLAGSGNPPFKDSCKLLINTYAEMFPDYKTLAEVALVIPVSSVAAERGFSLQNKIKTALRSRLTETKTQTLMTIASVSPALHTFNYEQASAQFKSTKPRKKV
uniref:HAT C-terminal dimerisation domain-containing protein n=1 Tax=Neogobius melanostomus TaxID=47308 RepID=A0A8C6STB8_9GOBI